MRPITRGGAEEENPQALTCDIIRGMKMMAVTCALMMCAAAFGAVMPQLPEPVCADTEVCTNVPCAALLSDVRELEVVIDFAGTASNCVQVAFGRDADGDGDLSANETDVAVGWRAGDCFIEDVKGGWRFREAASATNALHRIELRAAAGDSGARSARVLCDGAARFGEALDGDLQWLYRRDWNLAKVTRRGVDAPGEIVFVASDHGGMKFIMR